MTRLLIFLLLLGLMLYMLAYLNRKSSSSSEAPAPPDLKTKPNRWFRAKRNPREIWTQVYETADMDEARVLQARLQEEELECIVYEQGKKDIHGNPLKGIGIAVPKTSAPHAQNIISRMPV